MVEAREETSTIKFMIVVLLLLVVCGLALRFLVLRAVELSARARQFLNVLCFVMLPGLFFFTWALVSEAQVGAAKDFCNDMIVQVEAEMKRTGKAPAALDPKWYAGRKIPRLVNISNVYEKIDEDVYSFFFVNRFEIGMDHLYNYNSHYPEWSNYD